MTPCTAAYLIERLAIAVKMAKKVEGGEGHATIGCLSEPARIPKDATILAAARVMQNMPDNGPNRTHVASQGREVLLGVMIEAIWLQVSIENTLLSGEMGVDAVHEPETSESQVVMDIMVSILLLPSSS